MNDYNDVRSYCRKKGWSYREVSEASGPQLIVSPCPLCGEGGDRARPFYISTNTTKWNSYCCGEKGNLYTLKKRFGDIPNKKEKTTKAFSGQSGYKDEISRLRSKAQEQITDQSSKGFKISVSDVEKWHQNLFRDSDKDVLDYITNERGLTVETIMHFKLGVINKDGYSYISIPSVVDDEVEVLKLRNTDKTVPKEKKWKRIPGMQSKLFNAKDIHADGDKERIFICEAELDCASAWQLGMRPVVSATAGSNTFKDEWLELFEDYSEIIFLYDQFDSDKKGGHAGDDGAEKAATKLGKFRCKRAVFPAQDVNEWLLTKPSQDDVNAVVNNAVPYQREVISKFRDSSIKSRQKGKNKGKMCGIEAIDKLIDGFRGGEITLMSADSSIGKTTLGVDVSRSYCITNDSPVAFWPIEGTEQNIITKLWCQLSGKDHKKLSDDEIVEIEEKYKDFPFYTILEGPQQQEVVYSIISMLVRRFGVTLLVVDHISKLVQMMTSPSMSEKALVDSWMGFFCNLGKEFENLHIIIIAHPTKPKDADVNFEPEMHDLKGSSALYQDPDNVLILGRKRTKDRNSEEEKSRFSPTKFIAKKVRSEDGFEGMEIAIFDKERKKYITIEECNRLRGKVTVQSSASSSTKEVKKGFKSRKESIDSPAGKQLQERLYKMKTELSSPSKGMVCAFCDSGRLGEPCDMCGRNGGSVDENG